MYYGITLFEPINILGLWIGMEWRMETFLWGYFHKCFFDLVNCYSSFVSTIFLSQEFVLYQVPISNIHTYMHTFTYCRCRSKWPIVSNVCLYLIWLFTNSRITLFLWISNSKHHLFCFFILPKYWTFEGECERSHSIQYTYIQMYRKFTRELGSELPYSPVSLFRQPFFSMFNGYYSRIGNSICEYFLLCNFHLYFQAYIF